MLNLLFFSSPTNDFHLSDTMALRTSFKLILLVLLFSSTFASRDYYKILGIGRNASKKEIRRAYRDLSLKYHPDKTQNYDKTVEEKWMNIQRAYEVLSDDDKRRVYDRHGEAGLEQQEKQGQGGGNPFTNPFDFFRGHRGHQEPEEKHVEDVTLPLTVTLKQLYTGDSVKATISRHVVCSQCSGSGARSPSDIDRCGYCNGQGMRTVKQQLGPGFFTQSTMPCDKCGGKGTTIKKKCGKCKGKKVHRAEEVVTIDIDSGMIDGDLIELAGYTDEHPDMSPGNLKFVIQTIPDNVFERRGKNLYTTIEVTLLEALVGFKRTIKALDDHLIIVDRSDITSPGQVLIVKNEGMPDKSFGRGSGDLFVTVNIKFPSKKLTIKDKELLEKILKN
ncbi:hypothetical protein P9112_014053 [Eukaryota sp. TZLM1-RC]